MIGRRGLTSVNRRAASALRFQTELLSSHIEPFPSSKPSVLVRSILRACVSDEYHFSKNSRSEKNMSVLSSLLQSDIYSVANTFIEDMLAFGAITHPLGSVAARNRLAGFFLARDGCPTSIDRIALCNSRNHALQILLTSLHGPSPEAVFIESPALPSYSSIARIAGFTTISVDTVQNGCVDGFLSACATSRRQGIEPKVFLLSHPQKFTGSALSLDAMKALCTAADNEGVILVVDESAQDQPCSTHSFNSFDLLPGKTPVITLLCADSALLPEPICAGVSMRFNNFPADVFEVFLRMFELHVCADPLTQISTSLCYGLQKDMNLNEKTRAFLSKERTQNTKKMISGEAVLKNALSSVGMEVLPSPFGTSICVKHGLSSNFLESLGLSPAEALMAYCENIYNTTGVRAVPGSHLGISDAYLCISKIFDSSDRISVVIAELHNQILKE